MIQDNKPTPLPLPFTIMVHVYHLCCHNKCYVFNCFNLGQHVTYTPGHNEKLWLPFKNTTIIMHTLQIFPYVFVAKFKKKDDLTNKHKISVTE